MLYGIPLLSKRHKDGGGDLNSSSSRPHPRVTDRGPRLAHRQKGPLLSATTTSRVSGCELDPPPKRLRPRPAASEIYHDRGKQLCPHQYPDLGSDVVCHNVRDADLTNLQSYSSDELLDSAYSNLARVRAVLHILTARARGYEDMRARAEELEEKNCEIVQELSQLKLDMDLTRKQLEKELNSVRDELEAEITSGSQYLKSLGGQHFLKSVRDEVISQFKKSAEFKSVRDEVISQFKKSADFEAALAEASIPVFDECVAFLRERLANRRQFPGEFLDPHWNEDGPS